MYIPLPYSYFLFNVQCEDNMDLTHPSREKKESYF